MSELDTSAYTPANNTSEDNDETEEEETGSRTRFQIPLDHGKEQRLLNKIQAVKEELRNSDNEVKQKFDEIQELIENFDTRKYVEMHVYRCDRCGETFDKKQLVGIHHATQPNCGDEEQPWQADEPSYTKIRVE